MTTVIVLFVLGLFMIALGGDSFVGYACALARKLRVPPLIIGATVVSIGTTLPETIVSVTAAISSSEQIAVGNAFGSIICNSCLIGGIGAVLLPSQKLRRKDILKRLLFFLLALVFTMFSASKTGTLGLGLGIILLSIFAVYILTSRPDVPDDSSDENERPELICFGLIVSTAALYIGSSLLVDNGIVISEAMGIPEKVVALTFIALGTSLPELVTTIVSIIKKQGAMALGNVIGANILNLLLVIGLPCIIAPMTAGREIYRDLLAAAGSMALLTIPPLFTGKTYRIQGALLLICYFAYCTINFI